MMMLVVAAVQSRAAVQSKPMYQHRLQLPQLLLLAVMMIVIVVSGVVTAACDKQATAVLCAVGFQFSVLRDRERARTDVQMLLEIRIMHGRHFLHCSGSWS
jgi:cytochrome b561